MMKHMLWVVAALGLVGCQTVESERPLTYNTAALDAVVSTIADVCINNIDDPVGMARAARAIGVHDSDRRMIDYKDGTLAQKTYWLDNGTAVQYFGDSSACTVLWKASSIPYDLILQGIGGGLLPGIFSGTRVGRVNGGELGLAAMKGAQGNTVDLIMVMNKDRYAEHAKAVGATRLWQ